MFKRSLIAPLLFILFSCQPAFAFERITDATATPQQTFTEGNRAENIPATRVRAVWLNGVQEEIASVVEGQGLTLNVSDNTQLATAIGDIVSDHATLTNPHSATSTATADRLILRDASGRAKVSAPSASDDIARKAEVDAATSSVTTHAALTNPHSATSAATANRMVLRDANGRAQFAAGATGGDPVVMSQFYSPLTTDGYQSLPGGLIIQWGKTVSTQANQTVTFPTAFPNAAFSVTATSRSLDNYTVVTALSSTGFSVRHQDGIYNVSSTTGNCYWIAIGY